MASKPEKPVKKKSSSFVAALFAFALINMGLDFCFANTDIEYADLPLVQNQQLMRELRKPPYDGLVFLGSSIIEVPLALLDHRHYYAATPQYAQGVFASANDKPAVHDLSIEAGLISDQYLLLRRMSRGQNRPRFIILVVAPRDFYDTRWHTISHTSGFRMLSEIWDLSELPKYLDSPDQYEDFICYKLVRLYRMRPTLTLIFNSFCHLFAARFACFSGPPAKIAAKAAVGAGTGINPPADEGAARLAASLEEYKHCYQGIEQGDFYKREVAFLRTALTFAKEQKLNLLLVNMPLTEANRRLLPDHFYEQFRHDVSGCAKEAAVPYLDLSDPKDFSDNTDFFDSAHLGEQGGEKLLERLRVAIKALTPPVNSH